MPAIRCEVCKGTGKVVVKEFELDSIGKMFLNPVGFIGASVERTNLLESHTHEQEYIYTCKNCGGSGCKWENEDD